VLARRGLVSVDADDDSLLARFVDPAGAVVAEEPAAPDLAGRFTQVSLLEIDEPTMLARLDARRE
jgi:hypothetical protein